MRWGRRVREAPDRDFRVTIRTYVRPALNDGTPERIGAVIVENGKGLLTLPRDELHGGRFLGDRFSAHQDVARRLAGGVVTFAGMRPAGKGYNFWTFPNREEERDGT